MIKTSRNRWRWGVGLLLLLLASTANAFVVNINAGSRTIYLRVGDGSFNGIYNSGGTPANNSTINLVSVSVPTAALGNGVEQVMTSNGTITTSHYDGYAFCNVPAQVYIGGFHRRPGGNSTAVLTATAPANLVDEDGDTIPFSQISWTSSGNGDGTNAQPFPAGTFTGGAQTLANFPSNTWRESCHTFRYGNDNVVAAGTYRGRVTYTLTAP